MEFKDYKINKTRPTAPTKPLLKHGAKAEDYRIYADKLEEHEKLMVQYHKDYDAYQKEEADLQEKFKQDLFIEYGIQDNPKREKLWSIVWERGHDGGFNDLYYEFSNLVVLIL